MLVRRSLSSASNSIPPVARAVRRPRSALPATFYRVHSLATAASTPEPSHTLAVVGGGLSGLSSAFYFLKALSPEARKKARVVVLEKESRFGGWCKSVPIAATGDAVPSKREGERIPHTLTHRAPL